MLSNVASGILKPQSEKKWNEDEMSQCTFSCLHFPYKCPIVISLDIVLPMGGSNMYLQSANTVIHLSNFVKAY